MESSIDIYLHKKFKKQTSIDFKPQKHNVEKENKAQLKTEVSLEEKTPNDGRKEPYMPSQVDNNERHSNNSTNESLLAVTSSNNSTSSISFRTSITTTQSSNSCISYVVSSRDHGSQNSRGNHFIDISSNIVSRSAENVISEEARLSDQKDISYRNEKNRFRQNEEISQSIADSRVEDSGPKCGESYSKYDDASAQQDRPTGGKYVCTYCNLGCSKPSVLQKHIRAHTNERPYPCISCGFSFKTRSNLYKHCRSRTHANRVMGNKSQENSSDANLERQPEQSGMANPSFRLDERPDDFKMKPYKPRFHTAEHLIASPSRAEADTRQELESNINKHNPEILSNHINDIIDKNNSIVNPINLYSSARPVSEAESSSSINYPDHSEEPLNLTNKCRKRCVSEVQEPTIQKSLIKELLLKNLYADSNMQCPHCKMIFQTVTEFELHKLRSCKGFTQPGMKHSRSSSVNVASILTHNKNAFDNIPHMQNTVFPMKSPGPFLGKTRLVEGERTKSFSFEDVLPESFLARSKEYAWPSVDLRSDKEKKPSVKLFGGEVKIAGTSGDTESYKVDNKLQGNFENDSKLMEYSSKVSKNHVVKSGLQSGGTVLTSKTYSKDPPVTESDVITMYKVIPDSHTDTLTTSKSKFTFNLGVSKPEDAQINMVPPALNPSLIRSTENNSYGLNIMAFSQKAAKLLAPNLKRPNLNILGVAIPQSPVTNDIQSPKSFKPSTMNHSHANGEVQPMQLPPDTPDRDTVRHYVPEPNFVPVTKLNQNNSNPVNLLVNGKIVRYVPGMPGPVTADDPMEEPPVRRIPEVIPPSTFSRKEYATPDPVDTTSQRVNRDQEKTSAPKPAIKLPPKPAISEIKIITTESEEKPSDLKSSTESKVQSTKFVRPNSLALKPSAVSLKQHHGLTPTMFNQILISPDTPRVAKKYVQQFLHGNYFSYLGLKSSTRPVYCTLNKTQPFYTPHFKKLSMYSEWRQQDNKIDRLFASAYDSRQKQQNYSMAGKTEYIYVHSSYKFSYSLQPQSPKQDKSEEAKSTVIVGGYESKEDYTYIRGRGRGRYICEQCGIRCKKPSMLKKHIRTHSNDRPYTCAHCNFSFKTKGNLTKHMKSKAHTKNTSGGSTSSSSAQQPLTQSSESETDDSGMDSSDESTRQQEHEAAYGLLTLSQKSSPNVLSSSQSFTITSCSMNNTSDGVLRTHPLSEVANIMNTEEIVHVTKITYAKNKILDEQRHFSLPSSKSLNLSKGSQESDTMNRQNEDVDKSNIARPLTYPYTSVLTSDNRSNDMADENVSNEVLSNSSLSVSSGEVTQSLISPTTFSPRENSYHAIQNDIYSQPHRTEPSGPQIPMKIQMSRNSTESYIHNENDLQSSERKKRKIVYDSCYKDKIQKNEDAMDLSMGAVETPPVSIVSTHITSPSRIEPRFVEVTKIDISRVQNIPRDSYDVTVLRTVGCHQNECVNNVEINYKDHCAEAGPDTDNSKIAEYDNSAMETLADVATKQVKLEKNTLAKSVASEYLKLVTKTEYPPGENMIEGYNLVNIGKDVNELIVKPEESKSCTICSKNFSKSSHLRLHMNIHYLERPFRCDSCSVSFRTKGHLQKHERSASHHNKLTSSPALLSSEPRPFKCLDCNIAFRIHGHLAKHLRSKMHIMKLECLAKIPFGLYAELERSNSLLTEINTIDGDQCLESLKMLAKKVFLNDPSKLNQVETSELIDADS